MKIAIEANQFAAELYKLLGVTNSKGPLTVVSNALLTANADNTLTLEATDLEVTISTSLECEVEIPGQLCLNCHNLHSVVKGLRNHRVEVEAQENHYARLRSGDVDCRIVGLPPVEFPRLPSIGALDTFAVGADTLLGAIERTIFSISSDEGRPNLMGGYLVVQDGRLMMVSTDGHRLSKVVRDVSDTDVPDALADGVIIPRKSLAELRRTIGGEIEQVHVAITGNNAVFRFGPTTLMVRLVDAAFPDYKRVIPEENPDRQARIDRDEFTEKLKFVSLFTNARTGNVTVGIDGDTLTLTASDPDKGDGKESMAVQYSGQKVEVGFNFKYLMDVMGVLTEPQFRFQVLDAYSASLVLDGDRTDDLFLVMPMRL